MSIARIFVIAAAISCCPAAMAQMPDFVSALTREAYASAAPKDDQAMFSEKFARGFLDGFRWPGVELWSGKHTGHSLGFHAGQAYYTAHPEEIEAVMGGYGYKMIEADGQWEVCVEVRSFIPDDKSDGTSWWISKFGPTWPKGIVARPGEDRIESIRIRVVGYLSPQGSHGHRGTHPRELLITEIREIEANKAVD